MTGVPRPAVTLVQFSDPHIGRATELMHGVVDTYATLEAAIDMVAAAGVAVSALLFTGDLADSGDPLAYQRLRRLVGEATDRLGVPAIFVMGNHDDRAAFRAVLLDGDRDAGPYDVVHDAGGLRVIVLDTTTPGRHDGELRGEQLEWLAEQLREPAPRGTLLAMHHPPLPSPVPPVHLLRLRDAERLAAVVAGSDVRMIVAGHAHHGGCGALAGVPVWVAPALAYAIEPLPARGRQRGVAAAAFSRLDLIDGTMVATPVPMGAPSVVYDRAEDEMVRTVAELIGEG